MSRTLVINTGPLAKVVEIFHDGRKDSINLQPVSRAYLPEGAVVDANYAYLNAQHLKIHLPKEDQVKTQSEVSSVGTSTVSTGDTPSTPNASAKTVSSGTKE